MSGPTQNPYPPPPAAGGYDPLAGAAGVSLEQREPPPPLGYATGAIKSIKRHTSSKPGGAPGLLIHVDQIDGLSATEERAFRITFGGQFPQYAQRDCKRLCAAILGYASTDPRAVALDGPDMWRIFDVPGAHVGKRIGMFTAEATKTDPKTGKRYANTRVSTIGDASDGGGAPAPAAPVTAAPAAPSGPPAGWFAFPASDPRASTHWYNAQHATMAIGG